MSIYGSMRTSIQVAHMNVLPLKLVIYSSHSSPPSLSQQLDSEQVNWNQSWFINQIPNNQNPVPSESAYHASPNHNKRQTIWQFHVLDLH